MKPGLQMRRWGLVAGLVLGACAGSAYSQGSESVGDSYRQTVWFDALFDASGNVTEVLPFEADSQPQALWDQLLARVRKAHIPPVLQAGQPASFRTGVELRLSVNKDDGKSGGKGQVSVRSLRIAPLPIKRYAASYPKDIRRTAGWEGEVTTLCTVGVEGRCSKIEVSAPAGMPESVRRFAKVSLEGWRFKPQELNGEPVEGEFSIKFWLHTGKEMPVDFREPRKL